jgi:hypothetical protein
MLGPSAMTQRDDAASPKPDHFEHLRQRLSSRDPPPPLSPAAPFDSKLTALIDRLDVPLASKACLHLLNDDLTRSHEIVQSQEGVATFDYIHAIVHRREGDYSNSKYWFRQVGAHPVWAEVYGSDPAAPVRFVERCREAGKGPSRELERAQLQELAVLLQHVSQGAAV